MRINNRDVYMDYAATEDTLEDASSLWYYGDLTALN